MFPSASWLGSSRPTGRGRAALAVGAAVALAGLIFGPAPAVAQQGTAPVQRSYINPFPNGDRYRVIVLGDSLGDGLWSGLYRAFEEDTNLEFIQRAKAATGFARTNSYDWNKELADLLKTETYQIAIVMFGGIDGQMIRSGKDWLKVGTRTLARNLRSAGRSLHQAAPRREHRHLLGGPPDHAQRRAERRRRGAERRVPRAVLHQRRQVCRDLERIHRRGRALQPLRSRYDGTGQAAQSR